jgi:hypothetical protein
MRSRRASHGSARPLNCVMPHHLHADPSIDEIITAIVDDDVERLSAMLAVNREVVIRLVDRDRLLESRIFHWVYIGDTALHVAAAGYRVDLVELLLAAGADPNASANRRRSTPLHYAADGFVTGSAWNPLKQVSTIQSLLAAGAILNAKDQNGATALHRATRTRCAEAVHCLLEAGADVALRNNAGSTSFHLAVQSTGRGGSGEEAAKDAQRRIIEAFLNYGISPELTDGKGRSVFHSAPSEWIRALLRGNAA